MIWELRNGRLYTIFKPEEGKVGFWRKPSAVPSPSTVPHPKWSAPLLPPGPGHMPVQGHVSHSAHRWHLLWSCSSLGPGQALPLDGRTPSPETKTEWAFRPQHQLPLRMAPSRREHVESKENRRKGENSLFWGLKWTKQMPTELLPYARMWDVGEKACRGS